MKTTITLKLPKEAFTGKIVTEKYAKEHPKTTYRQTIKKVVNKKTK